MPEYDYTITDSHGNVARALKPTDAALPKVGYGGHPIGARPKRKALTVYQGRQPFTLEVPMLLHRGGESVERDRVALDNMATSEGERIDQRPPVVQIRASYPLPIPPALGTQDSARWWIEDLVWGQEFRLPPDEGGFATFKEVTVTFLEWSDREVIIDGGFTVGQYRVRKPPDTILSICRKHHMDYITWRQLNQARRSGPTASSGTG